MRFSAQASASAALLLLAAGCGEEPFVPAPGWDSAEIAGVELSWRVSGSNLEVEVSAPTTGWVAVGFDSGFHMENANLVIGYVSSGTLRVRDDFGTAENVHQSDLVIGGERNVTGGEGSEDSGVTTISFTMPMDSGDLWDKKLRVGDTYQVVVMYGEDGADDFTSGYRAIANGSVTIRP